MAEQGSFGMEALQNMMQAMVADLKQDNLKNTKQLIDKIADTKTRIDALETKFQQEFHEQAAGIENKYKEPRAEWKKDLKDNYKQIADHWNDKLNTVKHEQDSKVCDIHDQVNANINKTCEQET